MEELRRDVDIAQAEAEKQRKQYEDSRMQVESFAPERDLLQGKVQVRGNTSKMHLHAYFRTCEGICVQIVT